VLETKDRLKSLVLTVGKLLRRELAWQGRDGNVVIKRGNDGNHGAY
jgi:hypothetical protein